MLTPALSLLSLESDTFTGYEIKKLLRNKFGTELCICPGKTFVCLVLSSGLIPTATTNWITYEWKVQNWNSKTVISAVHNQQFTSSILTFVTHIAKETLR